MSVLTAEQLIAIRGSGLIDPSYANILDLLDTIDALHEQIATAERRLEDVLNPLLLQIGAYQCAVDDITSTFSHHALQDDCACKWCMEQREVLLLDDAVAAAKKARTEAAGPEGRK